MAAKSIDMIGFKTGRLKVIGKGPSKHNECTWICLCDCGNTCIKKGTVLRNHSVVSCGCYIKECAKETVKYAQKANYKHGLCKHPLYQIRAGIISRCCNKKDPVYSYYGGRGISICEEWLHNMTSFYEWSINNGWQKGLSLDRIDNNGPYSPDNCRWTTMKVQSNNRRDNRYMTYKGTPYNLTYISDKTGISYHVVRRRQIQNWTIEDLISHYGVTFDG